MYDRILLPTDGSTGTAHVAMQAVNLAQQYDGHIHVLHVVDKSMSSLLEDAGSSDDVLEERGKRAVGMIERMAGSHDVAATTEIRSGDPAETILEYADEIDADVIIAGTHGRSGVKRHLLGSVTERLVRHSRCPVLTVRLPETDVTVEDTDHARKLISAALEEHGHDAEKTDVERQLNVWVGEATTDDGHVVIYLDPITQRTSLFPQ